MWCKKLTCEPLCFSTHQLIEDVLLVNVDGDECLVLGPLVSTQVPGRHVDQLVQKVQKLLIGGLHYLSANEKTLVGFPLWAHEYIENVVKGSE